MTASSDNGVVRHSTFFGRLSAAWRRFAHDEYPDRITWAEAAAAIERAETEQSFPSDSWIKDFATRDHFFVVSTNGHAQRRVDRRTGQFEYTHVWPR